MSPAENSLLSVRPLGHENIVKLLRQADAFRTSKLSSPLAVSPRIGAVLFFEPSTRTRVGFEAAAWKLGYKTIALDSTKPSTSPGWSETIPDTIRTLNASVDFYFIRHPDEDIFRQILPYTSLPVINCGNGHQEHPTQALIDAYAMWVKFGGLDGLKITMLGDLKYSRSAHSLVRLLAKFKGISIREYTPDGLGLDAADRREFEKNNLYARIESPDWGQEDVVYSAGLAPISPSGIMAHSEVARFAITRAIADRLSDDCIILNPLPRIDEIDTDVDDSPRAYYFKQNELALYMRMAIIKKYCDAG